MIKYFFLAFSTFFLTNVMLIRRNNNRDQYKALFLSTILGSSILLFFLQEKNIEEKIIYFLFFISCILAVWWFYYTFPTGLSSRLLFMIKNRQSKQKIVKFYKKKLIASRIDFLKSNMFIKEKNNYFYVSLKGKIISFTIVCINFLLNRK